MADPWAEFRTAPASGGADPWADFKPKQFTAGETAIDAAKSLGVGAVRGGLSLGGMVGDLSEAGAKGLQAATDYIAPKLGVTPQHPSPERQAASVLNNIPNTESLTKRLEAVTGPLYKPQTGVGHVAETIGEFAPGALAGGQGVTGNLVRYAVMPGLATEAAGKALEGSSWKPYGQTAAGVAGSLANPSRLITPLPVSASRQAMLDVLHNEGVTSLTAGQKTGNEALRYLESASSSQPMAGGGAARIQGEGQRQFTEAATRRAGPITDASPESLGPNQRRLGNEFERLSTTHTLTPDNNFITDVVDAVKDYRNVPNSQQRAMVQGYVDDIVGHVNNGHMPGEAYQEMRSRLSKQSDAYRSTDPALSQALGGLQRSLDQAMFRGLPQAEQEAWLTARREYAAQKVLEKAASRAGEATIEGQITPANLRNTVASENRGAYSRGEGQFNDLARAGASVMAPLPNSGTAQRASAIDLLHLGNQATLGLVPAVTGRTLMSQPVQNYLANQLIRGEGLATNPVSRDLLMAQMLQRLQQPAPQSQ